MVLTRDKKQNKNVVRFLSNYICQLHSLLCTILYQVKHIYKQYHALIWMGVSAFLKLNHSFEETQIFTSNTDIKGKA